jgi:cytochrome c oxidase assembly protein subunit 19
VSISGSIILLTVEVFDLANVIVSSRRRSERIMSSISMGSAKQVVRPPQRGIFPLDHYRECKGPMDQYLECLKEEKDLHHKCKDHSKEYLQCRMDRDLMSKENLDQLGFSKEAEVQNAREYDSAKEKAGFVAGKHISKEGKWWWQSSDRKDWEA